ncbi:MAG: hypothetical protein ABI324_21560 [Ktedonobacteraceae bacterium]
MPRLFLFFLLYLFWLFDSLALVLLYTSMQPQQSRYEPYTVHDHIRYLATRPACEIADFFFVLACDMHQRGNSFYRIRADLDLFEEYLHEIAQENTQHRDAA